MHSNVDPISRLRRRLPYQEGPTTNGIQHISLELTEDPIKNMYEELSPRFEENLLELASNFALAEEEIDYKFIAKESIFIPLSDSEDLAQDYETSNTYSIHVGLSLEDLEKWKKGYLSDELFSRIIWEGEEIRDLFPQYQILRE